MLKYRKNTFKSLAYMDISTRKSSKVASVRLIWLIFYYIFNTYEATNNVHIHSAETPYFFTS